MKLIALGTLVLFLSACQTVPYQGEARNVSLKPKKEGVISIPVDYRDEDRQKASKVMANNCKPYRPEIIEEGEVAVGTKTNSTGQQTDRANNQRKVGSILGIALTSGDPGGKNMSSTATTTQIKEWHISYRCDSKKKSTIE